MKFKGLLFVFHMYCVTSAFSQKTVVFDANKYFDQYGVNGCFVLYDQTNDKYFRSNASYCDTGYIPASTFKIPNSVIAFEEKVVADTNQVFKWDGQKGSFADWNQDQTIKTAIKYSCVWVYMDIARKVGFDNYRPYMKSFAYGNQDITSPEKDKFWLVGSLRITANQQINFLRKFYHHQLNVSKRSIDLVKDIIVLEKTGKYKLSGKTGSGDISADKKIMWLVGYLEKDKHVYFYAMNVVTNDFSMTRQARYDIAKNILRDLKVME
jgi:beta-lactamase class D